MIPFQADDLCQAAYLWSLGHEPVAGERTATFIRSVFDGLDAGEAIALLTRPEFQRYRTYSYCWRSLRRMADEAARNGGRR